MDIKYRKKLYEQLEEHRKRPLIVYCTSLRHNADGKMATDVIAEMQQQLTKLPKRAAAVDLLLVSTGGDPTVAWRIVSLIRERVSKFSVLVPHAAYSAATLIALGADEIVIHPFGNLGPTDPQLATRPKATKGESPEVYGAEDMAAYFSYARDEVGITDQEHLAELFRSFADAASPLSVGKAVRGSRLSLAMGEKLLQLHMDGPDNTKAREISERLNRKFFHHGYPLSRKEAKAIGLPVATGDQITDDLMWQIWESLAQELKVNEQFSPLDLFSGPEFQRALFGPVPIVNVPMGVPEELREAMLKSVMAQVTVAELPPVDYSLVHAVTESKRRASRFVSRGKAFAQRDANWNVGCSLNQISAKWEQITIPKA